MIDKSDIKDVFIFTTIAIAIVAAICILPMIFLWAINTLSQAGGSDFYIPHGIWNYFVVLVLLIMLSPPRIKK